MKKNVLLIDDDTAIIESISAILKDCANLFSFQDGNEAIKFVSKSKNISICFVDYDLLGEKGVNLAPILRQYLPEAQIFLISGFDQITKKELAKSTADGFVEKDGHFRSRLLEIVN